MRQGRAFTLLELLVVFAVIVVLVAMLVPTLGRARDQARCAKCANNLREIGVSFVSYASQNSGLVPPGGTWNREPYYSGSKKDPETGIVTPTLANMSWPERLVIDGDMEGKVAWAPHAKSMYGVKSIHTNFWATGIGPFYCPASPYPMRTGNKGAHARQCTYGMGFHATHASTSVSITQWNSAHIVAADADVDLNNSGTQIIGGEGVDHTGEQPYGLHLRHMDGANFLMGGGQVEWSNFYTSQVRTEPCWAHP